MDAAEDLTQLEGRVVNGRFRLLRRLGGSKSSAVYLTAYDDDPPRMAAFKLVAAGAPDAELRLAGWIAAGQLSHKNLISTFDCGHCQIDDSHFVYEIMEFADEVLDEILPARSLTPDETRAMLAPLLDALEFLGTKGYVHGRLKPSNILVVGDRLKLSRDCTPIDKDYRAEPAEMVVPETSMPETSPYEAPELGCGPVTQAVDVWALGMTLVAALTQKPARWEPWTGEDPAIPAGIAEPFAQIARACLRVNPAQRCTLVELRAMLDRRSTPLFEARKTEQAKPQEPGTRTGSWKAALIAVAAVVVLAGAALIVRKTGFPATATKSGAQQTSASDSVSTAAPQTAPEKPSPSTPNRQAAAQTKPSPGAFSALPGGGSHGVLRRVNPDLLPAAQQSIRGHVDVGVRVTVDPAGNVTGAVLQSPSRSNYFNRVAVDAARQWKFAAGAGGAWQVQFDFRQDGIGSEAAQENQ
ncbi:MAG: TonB family protein [Terracidiphilus sp.]